MQFKDFFDNSVTSVGVITANNPGGDKLSSSKNYDKNRELLQELHIMGYETNSIHGKFANKEEEAFIVCNISKAELLDLAQKYGQKAVIYGELTDEDFRFEYLQEGKVTAEDVIEVYWPDVVSPECFFKAVREGDFEMPTFRR